MLNTSNQENENQNHNEVSPPPVRITILKKTRNNKCWQGCGEKGALAGGNVTQGTHRGEQYGGSPKKLKTELHDPSVLLLGIYLKKTKNTNLKKCMHCNVRSSIIYNNQDMEVTYVPINR